MEDAKHTDLFFARNENAIAETDAAYGRKPHAFLASICRHLSLHKADWCLTAKRNAEITSLTQELEMYIPDTTQDRILEGKELGRVLNAFLESLPKETRLIFLRRYWHVDTFAEIAARYGITERRVKLQLSRTRKKLHTYLDSAAIRYISRKFIEESENNTVFGKR